MNRTTLFARLLMPGFVILSLTMGGCGKSDQTSADSVATAKRTDSVFDKMFETPAGVRFRYTGPVGPDSLPMGKGHGVYDHGVYDGEYQGLLRHGDATYVTTDHENRFTGKFQRDFYSEGRLMVVDSTYYVGTFRDGEPLNGTWYTPYGQVIARMIEGKVEADIPQHDSKTAPQQVADSVPVTR